MYVNASSFPLLSVYCAIVFYGSHRAGGGPLRRSHFTDISEESISVQASACLCVCVERVENFENGGSPISPDTTDSGGLESIGFFPFSKCAPRLPRRDHVTSG